MRRMWRRSGGAGEEEVEQEEVEEDVDKEG